MMRLGCSWCGRDRNKPVDVKTDVGCIACMTQEEYASTDNTKRIKSRADADSRRQASVVVHAPVRKPFVQPMCSHIEGGWGHHVPANRLWRGEWVCSACHRSITRKYLYNVKGTK